MKTTMALFAVFSKKGQTSDAQVKEVQTWMNNYPRRIFEGYTPYLELYKIMGDDFAVA